MSELEIEINDVIDRDGCGPEKPCNATACGWCYSCYCADQGGLCRRAKGSTRRRFVRMNLADLERCRRDRHIVRMGGFVRID